MQNYLNDAKLKKNLILNVAAKLEILIKIPKPHLYPIVPKKEISEQDIQKEIKDTLARLSNKGGKSKSSKKYYAKLFI